MIYNFTFLFIFRKQNKGQYLQKTVLRSRLRSCRIKGPNSIIESVGFIPHYIGIESDLSVEY